ncbi:MAG: MFS transporter [Arachnia sp.]
MPSSPLRALAHYKSLFAISSGRAMALAVAARAPYAMIPLGTLTAITASTGSVASGGLATGVVAIATAVASPVIGRWADRRGQRFVLRLLTPINALALVMLMVAALSGWDGPALWLACLAVGLTSLPIGSFTRARWIGAARQPRDVSTAFSYESTVDELVFVLGPAFVGIAASAAAPAAPLALAAALVVLAGIPFAMTAPASIDGSSSVAAAREHPPMGTVLWAVVPAIVIMVGIGTFFGSVQTAVTERALDLGVATQAGLIYALMGAGSAITALLAVIIPPSVRLSARVLVGGLGMAAGITLASGLGSVTTTALALFVTGLFVGPTMVTAFTIAERCSPEGGTGVAMTVMQSAVVIGVSFGAATGGVLADAQGAASSFFLAAAAGLAIAGTGAVMLRRRVVAAPRNPDVSVELAPAL